MFGIFIQRYLLRPDIDMAYRADFFNRVRSRGNTTEDMQRVYDLARAVKYRLAGSTYVIACNIE